MSTTFYGDAIRELSRRDVHVVLDSEGEPLREGVEAEPWLVSPNQNEAEQLVGQELEDDEDFLLALDAIAEMGPRNVLITLESGCFALLGAGGATAGCARSRRSVEPVSAVGSGDVLLAQFLAAPFEDVRPRMRSGWPSRRRGVGARGRRRTLRPAAGEPSTRPSRSRAPAQLLAAPDPSVDAAQRN